MDLAMFNDKWLVSDTVEILHGKTTPKVCRKLVMSEHNWFRQFWFLVVILGLFYTSTVFMFRLAFIEFRVPLQTVPQDSWSIVDEVVNVIFCLDVVINFFCSYREGIYEVTDLQLVARRYFLGGFWIDMLACMPWWWIAEVSTGRNNMGKINLSLRLLRLQRLSGLVRFMRLRRVVDMVCTRFESSSLWMHLKGFRGVRIINFVFFLLLAVHLLACGWYLVAAMHHNYEDTWLAKRVSTTQEGREVAFFDASPIVQWIHAMYWVITVFSSVGFGDIVPQTTAELLYACFTMLVGAVIHGAIISHVVSIITTADKVDEFAQQQEKMAEAFARHSDLTSSVARRVADWVNHSAKASKYGGADRENMKQTVLCQHMPPALLDVLPASLFGGRLVRNRFVSMLKNSDAEAYLPVMIAMLVSRCDFVQGEAVYRIHDRPSSIFLVLDGTFAHVAKVAATGGIDIKTNGLERQRSLFRSSPVSHRVAKEEDDKSSTASTCSGEASCRPYPYRLFSFRSYFGEYEIVVGAARTCSTRCESQVGTLLVLSKDDFRNICAECPQFGHAWRLEAFRRHRQRLKLLHRLTAGKTYRHYAACTIQSFFKWSMSPLRSPMQPNRSSGRFPIPVGRPVQQAETDAQVDNRQVMSEVRALRSSVDDLRAEFRMVLSALQVSPSCPPLAGPPPEIWAGPRSC